MSTDTKKPASKVDEDLQVKLRKFSEKLIEEGTKSPRTIRLAALHLAALWQLYPWSIKHYLKELKVLESLWFCSLLAVAFDEDFEAELTENDGTRAKVSLLAKNPDIELTEAFINTELYARVCIAVLFYKLGDMAEMTRLQGELYTFHAAAESGKLFLLELLHSVNSSSWLLVRIKGIKRSDVLCSAIKHGTVQT
ncbi:hypothetical protein Droror1_Dr00026534 [Drosera rotundifolia]